MGSKLILLLGILAGAFLAYTCLNNNKKELIPKYNQLIKNNTTVQVAPLVKTVEKTPIEKPKPIPVIAPETKIEPKQLEEVKQEPKIEEDIVKLEDSQFIYTFKGETKLSVKLSTNDKTQVFEQFILDYCQSDTCIQDLTFQENIKDTLWQEDVLKIAAFLKDNSVKNFLISIDGQNLKLEGEFASKDDKNAFEKLLEPYSLEAFEVKNLTTTKEKIIIQEVKEKTTDKATKKTQNKINRLLKVNPVYFRHNSDKLTLNANGILTKIIATLKDAEMTGVSLKVEGHTDSGGDAIYNKTLSQKRAQSVKKYLLENGLQNIQIEAKGYGEENPITENPTNTANRRVEIYLIKGE